ncbi:hypothetical protein WK61_00375 [Burkholderia ubonensis]|nr:hypothetical protein WK61_00375 [Burkholderia ubonensis]
MRRPDRRGAWGMGGLARRRRAYDISQPSPPASLFARGAAAGGNARANGADRRRGAHAPGKGFPGFAYRIEAS